MYVTEIIGDILASDCKRPCKKTTSTIVPGPRTEQQTGHSDVLTQRAAVTTSTLHTCNRLAAVTFLGSNFGLCSSFLLLEGAMGLLASTARAARRGPCVAVNEGLSTIYEA